MGWGKRYWLVFIVCVSGIRMLDMCTYVYKQLKARHEAEMNGSRGLAGI